MSDQGRIRNTASGHVLRPRLDRYGYPKFSYCDEQKKHIYKTVHRAVAEAWIPKVDGADQVNHIDGNKQNNRKTNLEWSTPTENVEHSYTHLLNGNTSHVLLLDLVTGKETFFRSVKDLGRTLGIHTSSLVPLLKESMRNPIFQRYAVKVLNEELMVERANTKNFGEQIFVYDEIEKKTTRYSSILLASYHTGYRALTNFRPGKEVLCKIGYQFCYDEKLIDFSKEVDVDVLKRERERYLLTPYRKMDLSYYAYDYHSKEEREFQSLELLVAYLNSVEPLQRTTTKEKLSSSLNHGTKLNKTGLFKGLGIRSSLHTETWFPYTEEVLLSNRNGLCAPHIFYRVFQDGKSELVIGKENLCRRLGYVHDKSYQNFDEQAIVKSLNIPNLRVDRLNKAIP